MGLHSEEVRVGDHRFRIRPFLGREGLRLHGRVGRVLAPVVRELAKHEGESKEDMAAVFRAVAGSLAAMMERMDDDFVDLIIDLVKNTEHQTEHGAVALQGQYLDELLPGNYELLVQLVAEVVRVNNFFAVRRFAGLVQQYAEAAMTKMREHGGSASPSDD